MPLTEKYSGFLNRCSNVQSRDEPIRLLGPLSSDSNWCFYGLGLSAQSRAYPLPWVMSCDHW